MDTKEVSIKNIHEAFEVFVVLIGDEKLCTQSSKILSNFAYQIDGIFLI